MKDCSPSIAPIVKGDRPVYTRPNIAFVVGMLGRYQNNPGIDHWKAAKKVMGYLQGTKDYMLMYRQTDNLEWNCFLEKCKTEFDCNFHYGG
ncbi:hypothetical protein AAG906_018895 [Vitis piasezkii]